MFSVAHPWFLPMSVRPAALTHDEGSIKLRASSVALSIGANATVICGNTLGEYCLIGAGAVVTKDVPNYGLVYATQPG